MDSTKNQNTNYINRNPEVLNELEALIEKIGFGELTPKIEIHNRRITSVTFWGKKMSRYKKENIKAFRDILDRIKRSCDSKETTDIHFQVRVKNGDIQFTFFSNELKKKYDLTECE